MILPSTQRGVRTPYDEIKEAIIDGRLEPGVPLVEAALAERFGVSRTPVRDSLSRLEQDGLVRRTDRGMVVIERGLEEVLDIYETRVMLEGAAARAAAERRTDVDLARLNRLLTIGEAADSSDAKQMHDSNRGFHRAVWLASHNLAFIDVLDRLSAHVLRYRQTTLTYPGRWEESLYEHRHLVAAIEAKDAKIAAEIAEKHMGTARAIRLEQSVSAQKPDYRS